MANRHTHQLNELQSVYFGDNYTRMANKNQHIPLTKRNILFVSLLAFGLFFWSGCTDEDMSYCPEPGPGIILKYRYDLNMDYADKFADRVENLQAFIFDSVGILKDTLTPPVIKGVIIPGWERRVNIALGRYSILTWAGSNNFRDHFITVPGHHATPEFLKKVEIGKTKLSELRIYLDCISMLDEFGYIPHQADIKDLYHGLIQNVTVVEDQLTTVTTPLVKNTNTIRISIEGLSYVNSPDNPDEFIVEITGRNSHYKYDNTINEEARNVTYTTYDRLIEGDVFQSKTKTLRLMKLDSDPFDCSLLLLNIKHISSGVIICKDINLVDIILSGKIPARDAQGNYIVDENGNQIYTTPSLEYLDRQDVFDLKFTISESPYDNRLIVTVFVNDWKITNIYPV